MIFYFSGTGNTKWAAEKIAHTTGDRLFNIAEELLAGQCQYRLEQDERVGFFFPIHGWQPPHILRRFIRKMNITLSDGTTPRSLSDKALLPYTYSVCTCGDTVGGALKMFDKDLRQIGLTLHSAFSLIMPESYVCLPFMYTDTIEREKKKIATADNLLGNISATIRNREGGVFNLKTGPTPFLYTHVIGAYFNRFMIKDTPFRVDADTCISCGKCVSVCPVNNIEMSAKDSGSDTSASSTSIPTWLHNGECTCCLACYHYCPTHAINYGKITRKRGQYHFGKNK